MFAKRIIPCLDCKDGRVVKGIQFVNLRDAGDPGELAAVYNREGADELVMLDISASREGRATLMDTVNRVARKLFIPLTVGGGVRTLEDGRRLLGAGSDKVAINTAAVETPELITELAERFGSQAVVVAIDARRTRGQETGNSKLEIRNSKIEVLHTIRDVVPVSNFRVPVSAPPPEGPAATNWTVVTYGGTRPTGLDAVEWARRVEKLGCGEILLTSMDADGTQAGFDCVLTATISHAVHIPVIASGGAGGPEHFAEVFLRGAADAALAASIFHYETHTIRSLKEYLRARGVPVRLG
ncbi:MAG: imidazole glycerol phosphate synthase subunit HisF [Acidobacteriia bacterium]|nr:imidazole glycerol phosphate synthase subunit HisF [Terriglobia bacterium]